MLHAAALVTIAIDRLRLAKESRNCGSIEAPGYRIYFGWDGEVLVILLGGGTKRRQQNDIQTALRHWRSYKTRKAAGRMKRS
jgi:putative addiction module killer protein